MTITKSSARVIWVMGLVLMVIAVLIAAIPAQAIVGKYLPESELPAGICRLVAKNLRILESDGKYKVFKDEQTGELRDYNPEVSFCSGTLYENNRTVLTANHCTPKILAQRRTKITADEVRVDCRTKSGSLETAVVEGLGWPHPQTTLHNRVTGKPEVFYDEGLLKLKTPILGADPIPVAKTEEDFQLVLSSPDNCRAFGYGLDNNGDSGVLHGVQTPDFYYDQKYKMIVFVRTPMSRPGDSGGPLICTNPKTQRDWIVGTASQEGDFSGNVSNSKIHYSNYAPVHFNQPWHEEAMKATTYDIPMVARYFEKYYDLKIGLLKKVIKQSRGQADYEEKKCLDIAINHERNKEQILKKARSFAREGTYDEDGYINVMIEMALPALEKAMEFCDAR